VAASTVLLAAAQSGDEQAYVGLTSPHRRSLHIQCYRIRARYTTPTTRGRRSRGDMIAGITGFPRGHGAFEQVGAPLVLTTR